MKPKGREMDKGDEPFEDFGLRPRRSAPKEKNGPASQPSRTPNLVEPLSEDPLIGIDLGGFRVVRLVAEGGMGRVYEGVQDKPRRPVAIKVMRPGYISSEALRRFENEWEVLGRLRHPNIAQIFFASTCNILGTRVPYFVMEFIPDALSITKYAAARRLSTAQRLALFGKVCEAVAHGHSQGVVHRDLKPSNILVEPSGIPKIIDFGVARNVAADPEHSTQLTAMGQLIGTVQYMSPEQFTADPSSIDQRTDVYALGVILYELLAGRPPYELRQKHLLDAARVVRECMPVSPAKLNQNVTPGMVSITGKCLQKDRSRRYSTAAELASAISVCLQEPATPRNAQLAATDTFGEWLGGRRHLLAFFQSLATQCGHRVKRFAGTRLAGLRLLTTLTLAAFVFALLAAIIVFGTGVPAGKRPPVLSGDSQHPQSDKVTQHTNVAAPVKKTTEPSGLQSARHTQEPLVTQALTRIEGGTLPDNSAVAIKSVAPFMIGTHEITVGEWREVQAYAEAHGYSLDNKGTGVDNKHPVSDVSWYDVILWCNAKSEMDKLRPTYNVAGEGSVYRIRNPYELPVWDTTANGYRLPTESEWEWAASGGVKSRGLRYSGSESLDEVGWHPGNAKGHPSVIGRKKPNELGLFDMTGNVREWCWSTLDEGPEPMNRVVRGGGWQYVEHPKDFDLRLREYARRLDTMQQDLGFRIARNLGP